MARELPPAPVFKKLFDEHKEIWRAVEVSFEEIMGYMVGFEYQIAEARAIIEQVANWNIELSDTVGHARAWLEKYPDAAGGEHGE